jgi:hypothetical protein
MAADAGAAAIANEQELISAAMRGARHVAYARERLLKGKSFWRPRRTLGISRKTVQAVKMGGNSISHCVHLPSFQKSRHAFDQSCLVDRLTVANDLHLKRPDHIANKANDVHRRSRGDERGGDGKKGVAGANGVDYVPRNGGDCVDNAAALISNAAKFAMGDYKLRAILNPL